MKRKKWLFISAAIAAGFAFAFWRLSGCIETMGPKHGRVIDRDSGLGVAGVSIVAEGYFNATGPWESVHHCTFVQMTMTDEQGYYRFPGAYSHWFATGKANLDWSMYVSKNGYAPADLPWPMEYREDDHTPVGNFYWRSNSDAFHMDGWTAEVAPLQIKRVDANIQERIWLLSMSGLWKSCDFDMTSEQRAALSTEFADIEQRACHASGDERISAAALEKLRDEAAPRPGPFVKGQIGPTTEGCGFLATRLYDGSIVLCYASRGATPMKYVTTHVFVLLCTPLICNSYATETHATITAQAYLNSNLVPADKLALASVKLRAGDSILKR